MTHKTLTQQQIDEIFKSLVEVTRDYHNLMYLSSSDKTIRFSKVGALECWHDFILLDHSSKDRIVACYHLINAFNRVYDELMQQSSIEGIDQIFVSLNYEYHEADYLERDFAIQPIADKFIKTFKEAFLSFIKRYTDFVVKYQELALLEEVNNL